MGNRLVVTREVQINIGDLIPSESQKVSNGMSWPSPIMYVPQSGTFLNHNLNYILHLCRNGSIDSLDSDNGVAMD